MSGPLSNRLADLAERAGEAARAYRRGSIEAIGAYLEAGALLAEARGECRRGEWGAVLARAGIAERTGRLMVQAAKVARELGADAAAVHDAGGVQAFIAAAVAVAVEKPALNAGIEAPEPAGSAPVAHGPAPRRGRTPRRARQSAPPGAAKAQRRRRTRAERCERWPMRGLRRAGRGPDTVRAVSDSGRGRAADRRRRAAARVARLAGIAAAVEAAAGEGRGLSAADVERLATEAAEPRLPAEKAPYGQAREPGASQHPWPVTSMR